ncbi:hypothetical protein AA101099_2441 [Neoasaia chiangmaiensis NBRC 101099]|uniref:hypothetical protein n=1 Tax=Acetobacteraceae TaxID=433 RepID=UPI0011751721|nr:MULTISPECIES: hypothetical protein [Acetobacteraceae]GBR27055.1 hypothetical protein AA0488_1033 [Kozakia baliensis NRIC 0488]GBR41224.1 hypothetical protein AA101099_2441 [Neoasaia chiangmaiensis NBRC 101099]GEL65701.1 hypothetical protein KBA01_29870 [Kozakia baliensis]
MKAIVGFIKVAAFIALLVGAAFFAVAAPVAAFSSFLFFVFIAGPIMLAGSFFDDSD